MGEIIRKLTEEEDLILRSVDIAQSLWSLDDISAFMDNYKTERFMSDAQCYMDRLGYVGEIFDADYNRLKGKRESLEGTYGRFKGV